MKIIFITREGYNLSGARVRCYNFSRALNRLGMETEVFSFGDHLGAKYGEEEFEMPLSRKINLTMNAIRELSRKNRDALFFVQRLNYHTLAPFVASLFGRHKIIFDCDDWNIRENPVYHFGFYPSSKMEFATRLLARYAKSCIAASAFLKEYLKTYSKQVHYIPTGVDTDVFKPSGNRPDSSRVTLSWIGTVYHKEMCESVRFIIDCFSIVAEEYDHIHLNLAGTGAYFRDIQLYADSLPARNRIRVEGWIHPDKIPAYLDTIDIGLLPLIHETKFNMAKSPTKLFEYMAMAKPTVSSRIGEAAHIVDDGRTGFLAQGKEEFIAQLRLLIEQPALRKEVGDNARQLVGSRYSLNVLGRQLYEILTKMA